MFLELSSRSNNMSILIVVLFQVGHSLRGLGSTDIIGRESAWGQRKGQGGREREASGARIN